MSKDLELKSVNDMLNALIRSKKEKIELKNKMGAILDKNIAEDAEKLYEKYRDIYESIEQQENKEGIIKCLDSFKERISKEDMSSPEKLYEIADDLINGFKNVLNIYSEILKETKICRNNPENSKQLIAKLNDHFNIFLNIETSPLSKETLDDVENTFNGVYNDVKLFLKELELTNSKFKLKKVLSEQLALNNNTYRRNKKLDHKLDKLAENTIKYIFDDKSKDIELNYELNENPLKYTPEKRKYLSRRYDKDGKQLIKDFEPVYRGEPKIKDKNKPERKIIPSLFRSPNNFLKETAIFEDAVRHNSLEFEHQQTTFDKIALMQHYGIPTRLLDWSLNPLVALYFAVRKNPDDDGRFIVYNPKSVLPAGNIRTKIISDIVYFSGDYTKIPLKISKKNSKIIMEPQ